MHNGTEDICVKKRENKDKKPIDTKMLSWLLAECFAVMLLFAVCVYGVGSIAFGKIVYFGYLIIGVGLLMLSVWLNGGFDTSLPEPQDIVGNLSMQERIAFVEKIRRRKQWAKKVMFINFPFLLCLLLDTIYVYLPAGGLF